MKQEKIDAVLAAHMERIEDALDALAQDRTIPSYLYIETLQDLAQRCTAAAHAHLLETTQDREWAQFVVSVEEFLNSWPNPPDPRMLRSALEFHTKLRRWAEKHTRQADKAKTEALTERLLIEVFGLSPSGGKR